MKKRVGRKVFFRCNHTTNSKYDCNWECGYEWTEEGWYLCRYSPSSMYKTATLADGTACNVLTKPENHHNHDLIQDVVVARAQRGGQTGNIPKELDKMAQLMAEAGLPPKSVDQALAYHGAQMNLDTTAWSYQHIYNKYFRRTSSAKTLDLSELAAYLEQRRTNDGLQFEISVDYHGYVESVFFELAEAKATWARSPDTNVLLFDPTANTNLHGSMKLCVFVSVLPTGQNCALAVLLATREVAAQFAWGFRCFARTFRTPVRMIATDRDGEIDKAIAEVSRLPSDIWHGASHHYCVFHISVNICKRIRPIFGPKTQAWRTFLNRFWAIAKDSDITFRARFASDWNALVDYMRGVTSSSSQRDLALSWLQDLGSTAQHWAACFVWGYVTFGIHSTQRAKATCMQQQVKARLINNATVCELTQHLELLNHRLRDGGAVNEQILATRQAAHNAATTPVVERFKEVVTPWAYAHVLKQWQLSHAYVVEPCVADAQNGQAGCDLCDSAFSQFQVTYRDNAGSINTKETLIFDDDGDVTSYPDDTDLGLSDAGRRMRFVTQDWCSCQHNKAWGGLICRHIIAVCQHLQLQSYSMEQVDPKWLKMSSTDIRARERQLLTTPIPKSLLAFQSAKTVTETGLRPGEREQLLRYEMDAVLNVARTADDNTFQAVLQTLRQAFRDLDVPVPRASRTTTAHPEHVLRPVVEPVDAAPATQAYQPTMHQRPTNGDAKDLQETLGPGYTLQAELANPFDLHTLQDEIILYKWDNKGSGGWFVGQVFEIFTDANRDQLMSKYKHFKPRANRQCNVIVEYEPDESGMQYVGHTIEASNFTGNANASVCSWGIPTEMPLSNYQGQHLRPPLRKPKLGRPESARKAPLVGPTAKNSPKKRRRGDQ